jgi:hypothetical protein
MSLMTTAGLICASVPIATSPSDASKMSCPLARRVAVRNDRSTGRSSTIKIVAMLSKLAKKHVRAFRLCRRVDNDKAEAVAPPSACCQIAHPAAAHYFVG